MAKIAWPCLLHLFALLSTIDVISAGCTITPGWINLTMEEYMLSAEIVVYGRTKELIANSRILAGGKKFSFIDAKFVVMCILKSGEEDMPEEITISQITPRDGCSGTNSNMQIGDEAIIALKPAYDGAYQYDEVMPGISATYAATRTSLLSLAGICDMQGWVAPYDAFQNRCPICGVANFSDNVMASFDMAFLNPCLINGMLFGNDSEICQMLLQQQNTTPDVCVPRSFNKTCTAITFWAPSVSCECTRDSESGRFGHTDDGSIVQSSVRLLLSVVVVLICTHM